VKSEPESTYAWVRLVAALLLMTIGASGMYVVVVALPQLQAEFAIARSAASLPYTFTMIGFGVGGVLMGHLADRFGVMVPVAISALALGAGYVAGGFAATLWQFSLAQGLLIGFLGCSATFAPLVADTSLWFTRHRGIAVAICISGNYVSGAVWPPIVQHFIDAAGWRATYIGIGVFCVASMLPLALVLRRRPPLIGSLESAGSMRFVSERPLGLTPNTLQALLCVAGLACCVAMSMPLVHIVAYCGDLGFPAARGAEMLSLMLGFGVLSRLSFGFIADRLGGLRTLLLASSLQALAIALFLPFDTLVSLYVVSALFGVFQGGLVPQYAIVVREYFAPGEAGARVGTVLMATLLGMALGGWMSGAIFDLTGSYRAAFVNGFAWNLLNIAIIAWLLMRALPARARETPAY
jgi:MFS family permease